MKNKYNEYIPIGISLPTKKFFLFDISKDFLLRQ